MLYSIILSLFNKRNIDPEPDLYDDEKINNFLNIIESVDNMDICGSDYLLCNEKNEAIELYVKLYKLVLIIIIIIYICIIRDNN